MLRRFALLLEYDGTGFVGWQRQGLGLSLQQVLEEAAAKLSDGPVASITAGRTDAGVHATGQVVHMDLQRDIAPEALVRALNYHMKPHAMVVRAAKIVSGNWNARFSALARHYRYVILNRAARPALDINRVWHLPTPLDAALMHSASQDLIGHHDFSSFRASSCQAKSPVRTLDHIAVARSGELITIVVEARSFLHHQVRNMAGTLKLIGEGRLAADAIPAILAARARAAAGPTAPPEGLCMTRVVYDPDPFYP